MDQPIRILQCVTIMNRNGLENRFMTENSCCFVGNQKIHKNDRT